VKAWSLAASMLWMSAESDFTCSSAWLRASASVGVARPLLLRAAAACEIELREKDVGVCHSGEHGGAQVSLCSTPFTDSWRAQALTPSCATTRAGTKS